MWKLYEIQIAYLEIKFPWNTVASTCLHPVYEGVCSTRQSCVVVGQRPYGQQSLKQSLSDPT